MCVFVSRMYVSNKYLCLIQSANTHAHTHARTHSNTRERDDVRCLSVSSANLSFDSLRKTMFTRVCVCVPFVYLFARLRIKWISRYVCQSLWCSRNSLRNHVLYTRRTLFKRKKNKEKKEWTRKIYRHIIICLRSGLKLYL